MSLKRGRVAAPWAAWFAVVLTAGLAFAQATPSASTAPSDRPVLELVVSSEPTSITVGDAVRYSITVTWDPALNVEQKALEENLGDLVVRENLGAQTTTLPDGRTQRTEAYVITSYLVGQYHLPPPALRFQDALGANYVMAAEPIILNVRSVAPEDAAEIRDIKPPRAVWRDMKQVGTYAGAALAALTAMAVALYFALKFRRRTTPEAPLEAPHERALRRLRAAREWPREDHEGIKAYYVEIAAALREYLEGRFDIPAPLLTTSQLRPEVEAREELSALAKSLIDVFNAADFVKFARFDPDVEGQAADWEAAARFVEETRPPEPEPDAPAEGAPQTPEAAA